MPDWASTLLRCVSTTRPDLLRRAGHPDHPPAGRRQRTTLARARPHMAAPMRPAAGHTVMGGTGGVRGYGNACSLGPLFAVDSPRCRPDDHSSTRPSQPPLLATAAGVAQCPDRFAGFVLEHKSREYVVGRTYRRETHPGESPRTYRREPTYLPREPTYLPERAHVPTGESPRTYRREPTYLLERSPRTYWREPTYLPERAHVPTGEKPSSNLLFWKGLETRRLYRRLEEDTDNRRVCV